MSPRDRFSLVGHASMPFMNPLTEPELLQLVAPIGLSPGARTLDLGGGRGDFSRLLTQRFGCIATTVDASPAACDAARERTRGLSVEVQVARAEDYLATARPEGLALVSAIGAVHAFGNGLEGFRCAHATLALLARHVLLADVVALGTKAARAFEVARVEDVERLLGPPAIRLGPERVAAYERAWCANLEAYVRAHPGDPREAWARERLAFSESPELRPARAELGFAAWHFESSVISRQSSVETR